jgi:phosphatidylglycerophosphate synthase
MRYSYSTIKEKSRSQYVCWSGLLFFNKVAIPLIWLISNFSNIKPNQITLCSFSIRLGAAFYFYTGTSTGLLTGAVLYGISVLLDDVDGGLSRVRSMQTTLGSYMDPMLDLVGDYFCITAICLSQFYLTQNNNWLLMGSIVLFFNMFIGIEGQKMNMLRLNFKSKNLPTKIKSYETSQKKIASILNWLKAFQKRHHVSVFSIDVSDIRFLIFVIAPIIGYLEQVIILGCGLFVFKFVLDKVQQIIYKDSVLFN